AFNKGPGADDDFGRRLFLAGKLIVFNHKAIQTHHKAPTGGMRIHGAWWRISSGLFDAFPPATQAFVIRTYYHRKFWIAQFLLFYIKAKNITGWFSYLVMLLLSPIKLYKAIRLSSALLRKFSENNYAHSLIHK
ncbi:MAG: hypothetical protein N2044_12265, partial [Cyclobacteriaceae bacterium]|nr:hypothetical protein [Cyclobacteriaceae bacterium]